MPSIWEAIGEVATATRTLRELRDESRAFKSEADQRLRALERDVARLEEARATMRETVRAEIATAVGDLRVQYERAQAQRTQPGLPEGDIP